MRYFCRNYMGARNGDSRYCPVYVAVCFRSRGNPLQPFSKHLYPRRSVGTHSAWSERNPRRLKDIFGICRTKHSVFGVVLRDRRSNRNDRICACGQLYGRIGRRCCKLQYIPAIGCGFGICIFKRKNQMVSVDFPVLYVAWRLGSELFSGA